MSEDNDPSAIVPSDLPFTNTSTNSTLIPHPPLDPGEVVVITVLISVLSCFSLLVTHRLIKFFARVDTPWVMRALVGCAWFMGIEGVLVLLPWDLVTVFYGMDNGIVAELWRVVYWVTFALAWIVCPVAMEYHVAGHFTVKTKLWEAVKSNLKTYAIIGVFLVIIGGGIMITRGVSQSFIIAAVNVYGLALIIIMLGYGLVEVPMSFWRAADPVSALESQEFRAGEVETDMIDAEDKVDLAVEEVVAFKRRLQRSNDEELKRYTDMVLQLAPRRESGTLNGVGSSTSSSNSASARGGTGGTSSRSSPSAVTEVNAGSTDLYTLSQLHKKLKAALVAAERARWEWDNVLERTAILEKLLSDQRRLDPNSAVVLPSLGNIEVETPGEDEDDDAIMSSDINVFRRLKKSCCLQIHHVQVRGYNSFFHILAVLTGIASLVLLWSNIISPFVIHLSAFGALVHQSTNDATPIAIFMFSFFPLLYMAMCVYTALFKFKYLDVLALHSNRQTDAYNLLYNASYMGRLQFSLGVVYFQMLYEQDSVNTAFFHLVGDMNTVPFLGKNFNEFSPIVITIFALSSLFNCGDRILDFLGISTHRRPRRGNREHEERIEEGRRLIAAARARRERERRRAQPVPPMVSSSNAANRNNLAAASTRGYARVEDLLERL